MFFDNHFATEKIKENFATSPFSQPQNKGTGMRKSTAEGIQYIYNDDISGQKTSDPDLSILSLSHTNAPWFLFPDTFTDIRESKVHLIAIGGSGDKDTVLNMLETILYKSKASRQGFDQSVSKGYSSSADISKSSGIYSYLYELSLKGVNAMPVIIDPNLRYFDYMDTLEFDCGIITGMSLMEIAGERDKELKLLKEFYAKIPQNRPIIINGDEPYALKLLENSRGQTPITYGLGTKAAVTASSIQFDEVTQFNYCLQRSIPTKSGKIIEPFEMPISMRVLGNHNIYNALAAITCALYYDIDITQIKSALANYNGLWRRFQKIYDGSFTVIDSVCKTPIDFKSVFESTQILSYKNLYMVIAIDPKTNTYIHRENSRLIAEWAKSLGSREIILTDCADDAMYLDKSSSKEVRCYRKALKESGITSHYFHFLSYGLQHVLRTISRNDMLLLLGGDEMNTAGRTLKSLLGAKSYLH